VEIPANSLQAYTAFDVMLQIQQRCKLFAWRLQLYAKLSNMHIQTPVYSIGIEHWYSRH